MATTISSPDKIHSIESLIYHDEEILYFCHIKRDDLSQIEQDFISDLEETGMLIDYVVTNDDQLFYVVRAPASLS